MSQLKKKPSSKSKKDISEPRDFKHLEHVGPQDIHAQRSDDTDQVSHKQQPALDCEDNEAWQRYLKTINFEQFLRTVVREEAEKITQTAKEEIIERLENQIEQLAKEIERLLNASSVVSLDSKDQVHIKDKNKAAIHDQLDCNTDIVQMTGRSKIFQNISNSTSSDELKIPKEKPSPTPRYKQKQDGLSNPQIDQRQTSVKKKIAEQKCYSKPGSAKRRECMSQALQASIIPIVEGIEFTRSSLPEQLISSGHITEEECQAIRSDKTRKDQVRYIVSRTKSRSLQDMEEFVSLIEKQSPHVATKIREQYEINLKRNDYSTKCKLCLCYDNIDVKEAVDVLWSIGAVSDGFYKEVISCSKPRGCQEYLWQKLIEICNNKQTTERQKTFNKLLEFIENAGKKVNSEYIENVCQKSKFEFIVTCLKNMIENENRLSCHCHPHVNVKHNLSDRESNGSSRFSSYSPRSSTSDERRSVLSGELSKENDKDDDINDTETKRGTYQKLRKHKSLNEDRTDNAPKPRLYGTKSLPMLDTVTEESKAFMEGKKVVYQTLEFQNPIRVQVDFERTPNRCHTYPVNRRKTTTTNHYADDNDLKRYGMTIEDIVDLSVPCNSCI